SVIISTGVAVRLIGAGVGSSLDWQKQSRVKQSLSTTNGTLIGQTQTAGKSCRSFPLSRARFRPKGEVGSRSRPRTSTRSPYSPPPAKRSSGFIFAKLEFARKAITFLQQPSSVRSRSAARYGLALLRRHGAGAADP